MKPKCLRCTHYEDSTWCSEANTAPCTDIDMPCEYFKPMTNADHIRSMSDEELARELIWIQQDAYTLGDRIRNIDDSKYPLSKAEWMEWLAEPYKENTDE